MTEQEFTVVGSRTERMYSFNLAEMDEVLFCSNERHVGTLLGLNRAVRCQKS